MPLRRSGALARAASTGRHWAQATRRTMCARRASMGSSPTTGCGSKTLRGARPGCEMTSRLIGFSSRLLATASTMLRATCNVQHATSNMQHATCNMQHATCSMQHATCSMQHATCNMQHATCSMQHATCNMQHATCSKQHATCNTQRLRRAAAGLPAGAGGGQRRPAESNRLRRRAVRRAAGWDTAPGGIQSRAQFARRVCALRR